MNSVEATRLAFVKQLKDNEDDEATRLVYADFLDEQGEVEEADRQRKWKASKDWIVNLIARGPAEDKAKMEEYAKRYGWDEEDTYPDEDEWHLSYKELMLQVSVALRKQEPYIMCGSDETLCDLLRENRDEFWQHASIVVGIPLPEGFVKEGHYGGFRCAC